MPRRLHFLLGLFLIAVAAGHPDPRHSLEELDSHLAADPCNADLHLAKANIYRGLKLFPEANASVEAAAKLTPQDPRIDFERAHIDLVAGKLPAARSRLETLTRTQPSYAEPWQLLGFMQRDAGETDAGIASSRKYLELALHSAPDDFTELAARLSRRGGPGDREEAVTLLDRAASRFGGLMGIQLMAADLEVEMGRIDPALKRLDALAVRFRPRPEWSIRRGEILLQARRPGEAASAYDGAIALLDTLPPAKRDHPEARKLRSVALAGRTAAQAAAK